MLRIFPDQGEVSPEEAYDELDLGDRSDQRRPYVIVNMVETIDGQARIGQNTRELGSDSDQQLFVKLREQVDCVMAGARTIALEHYKGPAMKDETRDRREARGLRRRPLFVTATRSGDLPVAEPVFQDPESEIVVFSEAELVLDDVRARLTQVRELEPRRMLEVLYDRFEARTLLLEGGPHINATFFASELVDELFVTLAPIVTGADDPFSIVAGALPERLEFELASVLLDGSELFLRYRAGR